MTWAMATLYDGGMGHAVITTLEDGLAMATHIY